MLKEVLTGFGVDHSYWMVLLIRFSLGLAEGASYPCCYGYIAAWLDAKERSRGAATMLAGGPLGTAVAFLLLPPIATRWGWWTIFMVGAAVGAVRTAALNKKAPQQTH
jgi:MFS family permease